MGGINPAGTTTGRSLPSRHASAAVRGAITLAIAATGAFSVTHTLAEVVDNQNPASAVRYAPYDAQILGRVALGRFQNNIQPSQVKLAEAEARRALSNDLTSVEAVTALGLAADYYKDSGRARGLLRLSDSMSRRNLLTRLWLIEDAVRVDDIGGALTNFDIALRTSTLAADILFPVLGPALREEGLVTPITTLLNKNPPWAGSFLYVVATNGYATRNLSRVMNRLGKIPDYPGSDLRKVMLDQLVKEQMFSDARVFARAVAGATAVVDPDFTASNVPGPVGWQLADGSDLGADRPEGGGLHYYAARHSGGVVASQILTLTPGNYVLTSQIDGAKMPASKAPFWSVTCAKGDRKVATLPLVSAVSKIEFPLPADCNGQWLRLSLSSDDLDSREGLIKTVKVEPAP